MHELVVNKTKDLVQTINFILFFVCDEVTTMDQQSWVSIHAYVVENSFVVILAMNVDGTTSNNTKRILVDVTILYGV